MDLEAIRSSMVDEQLIRRGIRDQRVIAAFRKVPRHAFVPLACQELAYNDSPLPIGNGQTISQPYMVALMTECLCLKGEEIVLEIGTGSGYQAAILAELAKEVYSVERIASLSETAACVLKQLGYANVKIKTGDGTLGWKEYAPYDGIIVTAGSPCIPRILISQLKDDGRLVIPVGGNFSQILTVAQKVGQETIISEVSSCVFVPLIGKYGWKSGC